MKYTKTINLDVNKPFYEVLHAKQNDNARYLLFNLLNNGVPFTLDGRTVRAYAVKPDNTKIFNDLTIVSAINGQVELQLTSQMLALAGMITLELVIYEGTDLLSTTKIILAVISNLRSEDAIISTNEFSTLTNALAAVDNLEVNYAPRLNTVESSLSENTNKITDLEVGINSIGVTQIDKNKGKFDQTYMTEEFIQQMAGTTPVNAIPAENSITYNQMAFTPIVGNKSKNLFDKLKVTTGHYVDSNGALQVNAIFSLSDWMPVIPSTTYSKNINNSIAWYDINKVFISPLTTSGVNTITSPSNAYYARWTIPNTPTLYFNTAQFELGSITTLFESANNKIDPSSINPYTITKDMLSFKAMEGIKSKNLFDKSKVLDGYYIMNTDGKPIENAVFSISDWISVSSSTNYYKNTSSMGAYYDINGVFISGFANGVFALTTPSNAKYIRYTILNTELDKSQLEIGIIGTSYEAFTAYIDSSQIKNLSMPSTEPQSVSVKLKDLSPNFYSKWKIQSEDLNVVMTGDSISTTNYYTTQRTDAKNRPPLMKEFAYPTFIEEQLRWAGQTYNRFDVAGIFTEVATTISNPEYDTAWDWIDMGMSNYRPAITRILEGTNCSVSYLFTANALRCDFIYRTDYLNADSAIVSISKGNGYVQVYDETTSTWIEANGYSYSAKEADTIITGVKGNLRKSIYQKRLKMKTTRALNDGAITVTITNVGSGRLSYWGIQSGKNANMINFILNARGGHNIASLADFEAWDVDYWKPQLILWECPIINENLNVGDSSYIGLNMGNNTANAFANRFLTKALALKAKSYAPELITWTMMMGIGNNAIDLNNKWVYGYCNDGSYVSVPEYMRTIAGLFQQNNINHISMFEYYIELAKRISAKTGKSIRDSFLVDTTTTDDIASWMYAGHFNDTGAKISYNILKPIFIC